jgi:hypothetical protein
MIVERSETYHPGMATIRLRKDRWGALSLNPSHPLSDWSTLRPQDIVRDAAGHLPRHLASSIVRQAG